MRDFYLTLKQEFESILSSEKADAILKRSIRAIFSEGHFVTLLKKNDFENALFLLREIFALNLHDINTIEYIMHTTFERALSNSFGINGEQMIWLFDAIYEIGKTNTHISRIAHRFIPKYSELYHVYITKFNNRDVNADKKYFESALSELPPGRDWNFILSVIQPSFSAFNTIILCSLGTIQKFEPWFSNTYPNELAEYLFENMSILEQNYIYIAAHSHEIQQIFNSQTQQKLASLFLSQDRLSLNKLIFLLKTFDCFSELIKILIEKTNRDFILQPIYNYVISEISNSNLHMVNDFIFASDIGTENDINSVHCTAAVLMYCAKIGKRQFFECIVEQQKDIICQFPQFLPIIYNTVADMVHVEHSNLKKEFHLVSHSTEILLFIIRHEILRKYFECAGFCFLITCFHYWFPHKYQQLF